MAVCMIFLLMKLVTDNNLIIKIVIKSSVCGSAHVFVTMFGVCVCKRICVFECISRVSDQNGVCRLYIIVEIYHSGRKPSIFNLCVCLNPFTKRFHPKFRPAYWKSSTMLSLMQAHTLKHAYAMTNKHTLSMHMPTSRHMSMHRPTHTQACIYANKHIFKHAYASTHSNMHIPNNTLEHACANKHTLEHVYANTHSSMHMPTHTQACVCQKTHSSMRMPKKHSNMCQKPHTQACTFQQAHTRAYIWHGQANLPPTPFCLSSGMQFTGCWASSARDWGSFLALLGGVLVLLLVVWTLLKWLRSTFTLRKRKGTKSS